MATSDESLLAAIRENGDGTAYAELYRRHIDAARGAAYRIAPTLDLDDVVSESFARILRALRNGAGPAENFRPYLYQTIRKVAIDLSPTTHAALDDREDIADPESLHDIADVLADKDLVASALAEMPERWRTVLWYTEVEGLTPRAVARIMGLSASNVSVIRHRARKRLRLLLEEGLSQHGGRRSLALGRRIAIAILGLAAAEALLPRFASEAAHAMAPEAAHAAASETGTATESVGTTPKALALGGAGVAVVVATVLLLLPFDDETQPQQPRPQTEAQQPGIASDDDEDRARRAEERSDDPKATDGFSPEADGSVWKRGPWEIVELKPPVIRGPAS